MNPSSPLFMILTFVLLTMGLVGGIVLLMPLSRQVAKYLEFRMKEPTVVGGGADSELRQMRAIVESLQDELHRVSDRQAFLEEMLESRTTDAPKLPR